jgi:acylphosphatase
MVAVSARRKEGHPVRKMTAVKREFVTLFGRVQGVGFRDHVVEIAARFDVAGFVRNVRGGDAVAIDVEGSHEQVDAFIEAVVAEPPRLARIERVERTPASVRGVQGFRREGTW